MSQREKVLQVKKDVSSQISELCRYIGFGLVAVAYAVLTSSAPFATGLLEENKVPILISALMGCTTILFDYLQYLSGYFSVNEALNNKNAGYHYIKKSLAYKMRGWCFIGKQAAVIIGLAALFTAITKGLL